MRTATLKIVRIGNSRGVRLPAPLLARHRIGDTVVAESRRDGLMLRPAAARRLSWEATFKQMSAEHRKHGAEFADLEGTSGDGLDRLDE